MKAYNIYFFTTILLFCQFCKITQTSVEPPQILSKINSFDSEITQEISCGSQANILIILSKNGLIYRSTDRGVNWVNLEQIFITKGKDALTTNKNGTVGHVLRMVQSKKDLDLIIFRGSHGINWISQDCAKTIKANDEGRKITEFSLHPTERDWVLASAWTVCEDFISEGKPCQSYKELFVSLDLGNTWNIIAHFVVQFSWAVVDENSYPVPKNRILLSHQYLNKGNQTISGWSDKIFLCYSDDFFKTSKNISEKGNKFHLTSKFLYIAEVKDVRNQTVNLLISKSNSINYTTFEVNLPVQRSGDYTYNILDDSDGELLLNLNYQDINSQFGTVFKSDNDGLKYSFSLLYNVRHLDGLCEFQKAKGVVGVYLANVFDTTLIDQNISTLPKKTLISIDGGSNWKTIRAPTQDSLGNKIQCEKQGCYLQLQILERSRTGDILSSNFSDGLLIANGNIGMRLSVSSSDVNTFISRNAGRTWIEVRKGSHIFEIGDHGGVILMVPDKPTDTAYYSWDYGLTWDEHKFSNDKISVKRIESFEKHKGLSFILSGVSEEKKALAIQINLYNTRNRTCSGLETPNNKSSDYEISNINDPNCFNKQQISYVVRKSTSKCRNGENFERPILKKPCATMFSLRKKYLLSIFIMLVSFFIIQ